MSIGLVAIVVAAQGSIAEAIVHRYNTHAALVAERDRLREALEAVRFRAVACSGSADEWAMETARGDAEWIIAKIDTALQGARP